MPKRSASCRARTFGGRRGGVCWLPIMSVLVAAPRSRGRRRGVRVRHLRQGRRELEARLLGTVLLHGRHMPRHDYVRLSRRRCRALQRRSGAIVQANFINGPSMMRVMCTGSSTRLERVSVVTHICSAEASQVFPLSPSLRQKNHD